MYHESHDQSRSKSNVFGMQEDFDFCSNLIKVLPKFIQILPNLSKFNQILPKFDQFFLRIGLNFAQIFLKKLLGSASPTSPAPTPLRTTGKGLFIQNATANAAWRRSRRNGRNKTNYAKAEHDFNLFYLDQRRKPRSRSRSRSV